MNYSSELSVYKKVGFVSTKKEIGKASKSEVLEKFSKYLKEEKPAPAVRYHVKNGVPYKVVNGKMIPLIKVVKA